MLYRFLENVNHHLTPNKRTYANQDRLLNQTILTCFLIGFFALIGSSTRIFDSGFQIAQVIHFLICCLLGLVTLFRRKLTYTFRVVFLLSLIYLAGIFGMFSYGLVSQGGLFLICCTILTTVFASKHAAFFVLLLNAISIVVFMVLYTSKTLIISFDLTEYHHNYSSWITHLVGFFLFGGTMVTVISSLFYELKLLANQLNKSILEIKDLNTALESKIKARTYEIEQSNKDKDRILGTVAHDLNNKLHTILGYLSLITQNPKNQTHLPNYRYIKKAEEAGKISSDIVKEMTEYAHELYNINDKLVTEPVDIYQFTESLVELHYPRVIEKNIELKMGKRPGLLICDINKAKLSQVIENLITNAIKFTSENGEITIDIDRNQDDALLTVKDTGIGIPNSIKETIFDFFTSSSRPGTAKEKSTGLGLSISKKIIESHSGKIWFESTEGKGSTFYLKLPLSKNL